MYVISNVTAAETHKKMKKSRLPLKSPRPSRDVSLTSFIPWHKLRTPPIYPNAQSGPIVTITEFYLFFVAAILLVITLGLGAMSIWSLFFKFPCTFFVDCSPELGYFPIPAALLCLPCSWIVFSVHNDEKSRKFLSLVLLLLTFSIVLTVIGVYIGYTHKLRLNLGQIEKNPVLAEFRENMRQSMKSYGRGGKSGRVWDEVQSGLGCCGVDDHTDWLRVGERVPGSCCRETVCGDNVTSTTGCLKVITAILASQTCLFSGINGVALFLQCSAFIIVAAIYFCGKRHQED